MSTDVSFPAPASKSRASTREPTYRGRRWQDPMDRREHHRGETAARKRSHNPAGVAMVMQLNNLEAAAGPPKVSADGTKSVKPTEQGQIGKAGGKGSIVAAAIVAVLAGLCRPRPGVRRRRPNFEGTDPELVARLAELAMELGCPELARVLTCSRKAARDGVRLAAKHVPEVVAGTRHTPARVRLGECFEQVKTHLKTEALLHPSASPDASYFEPASYASIFESKSKVRVYGHVAGTTAPESATCRGISGSAKAPRKPTSKAVQSATLLTLGGPAPAHHQPLTLSGWCLAARSLGKAAMIAAALILDAERRDGVVWDDVRETPPGQKPETAKARCLLEGFSDRPRKLDIVTAARGLVALARAGLLRISGSTWYRVAPGEDQDAQVVGPWALCPALALYGIESAPSREPMPASLEVNDLVRWLRDVTPASDRQQALLGRFGIDASGMSRIEASALQRKLVGRMAKGLRHDALTSMAACWCPDLEANCVNGHVTKRLADGLAVLRSLKASELHRGALERQQHAAWEQERARRVGGCGDEADVPQDEQPELGAVQRDVDEPELGAVSEDEADALFRWIVVDEDLPAANHGEATEDCPPIDWSSMLDEADMLTVAVADDVAEPVRAAAGGAW